MISLQMLVAVCGSKDQQAIKISKEISIDFPESKIPVSSHSSGWAHRCVKSLHLGDLKLKFRQRRGCKTGKLITPPEIDELVAPGKTFAYDLTWECYRLRFIENMSRENIRQYLSARGIEISDASISHQYWEAAAYLEQIHLNQAAKHGDRYREKGFVLAIDSTNEGGSLKLITARDNLSGESMISRKFPVDDFASYCCIMLEVKEKFGMPDAILSDMCPRISKAVNLIFPDTPHAICDYHFLRNVGDDLMDEKHILFGEMLLQQKLFQDLGKLKKLSFIELQRLKKEGLNKTSNRDQYDKLKSLEGLLYWGRNYKADMKGERFPFELRWLFFHERLKKLNKHLLEIKNENPRQHGPIFFKVLQSACKVLARISDRRNFKGLEYDLRERQRFFTALRNIFRPAKEEQAKSELQRTGTALSPPEIKLALKKHLKKLCRILRASESTKNQRDSAWIIIKHIEKYIDKLCLEVRNSSGKIIPIDRTNNVCERGFGADKKGIRRRCGKARISREIDHLPAAATLASNFKSPAWLAMTFGNKQAWELFHTIDRKIIQDQLIRMKDLRQINKPPLWQAKHKDFPAQAVKFIKDGIAYDKTA